jgi:hypothetical protein
MGIGEGISQWIARLQHPRHQSGIEVERELKFSRIEPGREKKEPWSSSGKGLNGQISVLKCLL